MSVASYLAPAKRHWPVLAASAVICGAVLGGLPFLSPPAYQAQTTLQVTFTDHQEGDTTHTEATTAPVPDGPTLPPEAPGRQTARRVTTFTQLANSDATATSVIAAMRLPYTPRQLADQVRATTPLDSNLIEVRVVDNDPARAAAIANNIGAELVDAGQHSVTPAGEKKDASVEVLQPAYLPSQRLPVQWQLPMVLGLLAGLALGLVIVGLRRGPASLATAGPSGPTGPTSDPDSAPGPNGSPKPHTTPKSNGSNTSNGPPTSNGGAGTAFRTGSSVPSSPRRTVTPRAADGPGPTSGRHRTD